MENQNKEDNDDDRAWHIRDFNDLPGAYRMLHPEHYIRLGYDSISGLSKLETMY